MQQFVHVNLLICVTHAVLFAKFDIQKQTLESPFQSWFVPLV